MPDALLPRLTSALAPSGLNLLGVADPAAWDAVAAPSRRTEALLPGARSILVLGNGGPAMWRAFLADLDADPRGLTEEPHPFDAYARRSLDAAERVLADVPGPRRWFRAAADETVHLDFRVLAHLAGLGSHSRLGLLLNPVHGPWVGLRAACFLPAELPFAAPLTAGACDTCPAPCVTACPGSAFPGGRWSVDACSAFHQTSAACDATCHARVACPEGAPSRYDEDQLRYHYQRSLGRPWLRARLGLTTDRYEGDGPHWGDWRRRALVREPG